MVLWEFLNRHTKLPWSQDFCAVGRVVNGELVAVIGFNSLTGTSCHGHGARVREHKFTDEFIKRAFELAFKHLNLKMIFALVPSGHERALECIKRLGFHELMFIPDAHPSGGLHYMQILRDGCRWLEE